MMTEKRDARRLVDKLWSYCNVLRDDGVGVIEYTEQLTYLLFLKMAHERATRKLNPQQIVPAEYSWQRLLDAEGTELEVVYTEILVGLAQQPGTLGTIFRKAQNRIQDPAKLKRLIVDLIDQENWSASGTDLKGDAYEELLSKGASDKGSGAGQYFTPRDLIAGIVDVIDPKPGDTVVDPACGTGGFLLVAHEHAARHAEDLTPTERSHLRDGFASGYELVDGTARLAAMNLLLHGIGTPDGVSLIEVRDALIADPGQRWSVVLSNPPFGRKSSLTMVGADGREVREDRVAHRGRHAEALAEGRGRPLDDDLGRRQLELGAPVGDQLAQLLGLTPGGQRPAVGACRSSGETHDETVSTDLSPRSSSSSARSTHVAKVSPSVRSARKLRTTVST